MAEVRRGKEENWLLGGLGKTFVRTENQDQRRVKRGRGKRVEGGRGYANPANWGKFRGCKRGTACPEGKRSRWVEGRKTERVQAVCPKSPREKKGKGPLRGGSRVIRPGQARDQTISGPFKKDRPQQQKEETPNRAHGEGEKEGGTA